MAKSTRKMKNCRTVAPKRNQEHNNNATQPSPPPAKDGQTSKRPKRKARPDKRKPAKRPRIATETDLHVKVPTRKVSDAGEGPSQQNKKRRRDGEETPPSLMGTGGDVGDSNLNTSTAKRKANTAAADEMPRKKRKQYLGTDRKEDVRKKEEKKKALMDPPPQKRQWKRSRTNRDSEDAQREDVRKKEEKKKAPMDPPPQKRQKKRSRTKYQSEERSEGTSQPATKRRTKQYSEAQRGAFLAKYEEMDQLGEGGCGSVFAGRRKSDNLPVAIKHIPKNRVYCKHVCDDGQNVSVEVAILTKLSSGTDGSVGSSAPVSLLDWYELKQELILVLERPVPCVDLYTHIETNGGSLSESEAKVILKQLVDATKELEDHEIFHRDIKMENILIETGSDVPRLRLIDFGLGCLTKKGSWYHTFYGTSAHTPPEVVRNSTYRAGPTTVWQVGVVLFEVLHRHNQFMTTKFLHNKLRIKMMLSDDCKDFLDNCLATDPKHRPTLEQLQRHPWLR